MSDANDFQLELLPLKKSSSSSPNCKDDCENCAADKSHYYDNTVYGSTLLPRPGTIEAVEANGRRTRVLPRVKERIREGSQKIRDKGRRWKEQKVQQRRLDAEAELLQRVDNRFTEMSPRTRVKQHKKHRIAGNNRRFDSEFDILEACPAKKSKPMKPESCPRTGNDVQNVIGKDGRKKSDMAVHFDRDDAVYSTGDTVKGYVNITLTQDVRVKDLELQFQGQGRVSWGEQRAYIKGSAPKVLLRNSEVFLDHSMSLMRKEGGGGGGGLVVRSLEQRRVSTLHAPSEGDDGIYLPAGVHNYPFEFDLPHDLPGSFDGKWGHVKYWAKAILVRPWKFDIEREKEFTVKCIMDLNDEPELARPIGVLGEFSPGIMCIRTGAVTVDLRIGRRGYVPGETIQFYVEVENNSSKKLQDTCVALVQHVTYRAGKKMRKSSVNVASIHRGETQPYSTTVWNTESVTVPVSPGTSCKYYKAIQIKYTVSLLVKYSSWADDFCLSVPIVLGTTGLRRQTINTYLSMLGYGQTPRASPSNGRRNSNSNGQTAPACRPSARQSLTAPPPGGSTRHSSVSSLQSVSRQRRISPAVSTRHRRVASTTSSASKDIDDISLGVIGSKLGNGSRNRLTQNRKPNSKSLDSTDLEEDEQEVRLGRGGVEYDEGDDEVMESADEGKRAEVK